MNNHVYLDISTQIPIGIDLVVTFVRHYIQRDDVRAPISKERDKRREIHRVRRRIICGICDDGLPDLALLRQFFLKSAKRMLTVGRNAPVKITGYGKATPAI
jgi:hypothetical protein